MKNYTLLILSLLIATQMFSQGWGYDNNRIAVSADGNNQPDPNTWGGTVSPKAPSADAGKTFTYNSAWQRGDEDDWSATPSALAMLAKAGLQGKLVHYSYNNFIGSPAHTTARNVMKEGAEGAQEKYCFEKSVFYDVSANNTAAINHLAAQIAKSTESDPLYFLQMGPTEFLYRALEKVKADGKIASINHLYILSHSNYNDNHIRREGHRRIEHVLNNFPVKEGVNFKRIIDQNNSTSLTAGWSSSKINGEKNWSPYFWMRDHSDSDITFLWDMLNVDSHSKPDISDAGLVWFLLRGDQYGNPSKLQTYIGTGLDCDNPTPEPCNTGEKVTKGPNWIAIDATSTKSPLGNWVKVKKGDTSPFKYHEGAIQDDYLVFNGNSYGSGTPNSPLEYTFTVPKTGTYRIQGRMRQHLEVVPSSVHEKNDKCNDMYIRMEGNFSVPTAHKDYKFPKDILTHDLKFYGRSAMSPNGWGTLFHAEAHDFTGDGVADHGKILYNLTAGEEYTIIVSGRSKGFAFDYLVLYENPPIGLNAWGLNMDIGTLDPTYVPGYSEDCDDDIVPGCETILAKDFNNRSISGYDPADDDWRTSGGVVKHVLYCKGTNGLNQPSAAEIKYSGKPQGNATFTVHAMQEPDGECTYEVFVNGKKVGEKKTTDVYETTHDDPDKQYAIEELVINTKAAIKTGDIIRVTSNQVTNGKVPEGDKTATARGRWHAVEVCVSEDGKENNVAFVDLPEEVIQSQSIPVSVSYTALEELEVVAVLSSPAGDWLGNAKQKVQTGSGTLDLTIALSEMPAIADNYNIKCDIRPVDGAYDSFLKEDKATINIVGKAFHGTPIELPGTIEAEDYDNGGEGVAYHDIDPENKLEKYRTDGVDVEVCAEGGFNIGYTAAEEWLTYTVNVTETGTYTFTARTASDATGGSFHLEVDGVKVGQTVTTPLTNDWHVYTDVVLEGIELVKGEHVVKFVCETNGFNLDKFIVTKTQGPQIIGLKKGWNLIGCPIKGGVALKTTLADIWDKVEIVKDFDGFYNVENEDFLNSLSEFEYGKGYFIKVTEDCELIWK